MGRPRVIWISALLLVILGAAALGTRASSAAPRRAAAPTSTLDRGYSCRVRRQHFVDVYASVTLPPVNNRRQPAALVLNTGTKTVTEKSGTTITPPQLNLRAVKKNSLRIDTSSCRRVKQQIPVKPKGLPGPPITVTPTLFGHDGEQCGTAARVLVRLRLETTNHTPTRALLAIRNDNLSRRPIGFYDWSQRKVVVYIGKTCVSSG
jgi:hypothetical protein